MNRTLNSFTPSLHIINCKGRQFVPFKPSEQFLTFDSTFGAPFGVPQNI